MGEGRVGEKKYNKRLWTAEEIFLGSYPDKSNHRLLSLWPNAFTTTVVSLSTMSLSSSNQCVWCRLCACVAPSPISTAWWGLNLSVRGLFLGCLPTRLVRSVRQTLVRTYLVDFFIWPRESRLEKFNYYYLSMLPRVHLSFTYIIRLVDVNRYSLCDWCNNLILQ